VGYCRTHTAKRDTVIATVTAGYADGIPRALSNKGRVKINGEIFNIVGNVCMDLLMVDITDAKNSVSTGDEVIFWGEDGISIDEYAVLSGEISYTLYTGISPRVTRIYE
jgi:alanine racemase